MQKWKKAYIFGITTNNCENDHNFNEKSVRICLTHIVFFVGPVLFPPGPAPNSADTSGVIVGASGYGFVPPNAGNSFWGFEKIFEETLKKKKKKNTIRLKGIGGGIRIGASLTNLCMYGNSKSYRGEKIRTKRKKIEREYLSSRNASCVFLHQLISSTIYFCHL